MKDEIKEVIKKHLPEQVGTALQERLNHCDSLEKQFEAKKQEAANLVGSLAKKQEECESLFHLKDKEIEFDERELAISKRERDLKVKTLEITLEAANNANKNLIDFVGALMRNTTYRKTAFPNSTIDYRNGENATVVLGESDERVAE